jgi:hypothetical protein
MASLFHWVLWQYSLNAPPDQHRTQIEIEIAGKPSIKYFDCAPQCSVLMPGSKYPKSCSNESAHSAAPPPETGSHGHASQLFWGFPNVEVFVVGQSLNAEAS